MSFSISHEQLPNYTRCDSNWFVFSIFNLLQLSPTARSLQELGFALYNAFRRLFDIPDLFTVFPQKYFIQRRRTPTHLSTVHETVFRKLILITKIKKSLYGRGRRVISILVKRPYITRDALRSCESYVNLRIIFLSYEGALTTTY